MKQFSFPLETIRKYKEQVLDNLLSEMAVINAALAKKQLEIDTLKQDLLDINREFNEKNSRGILLTELNSYKVYIKRLQRELESEYLMLANITKQLESKKEEVLEARKENLSIEKLKEKKLTEYNKMVSKSEEIIVEEFVVNNLVAQRQPY